MTRDRKAVEVEWRGVAFDVVDTGGWLAVGRLARGQGLPAGRGGSAPRPTWCCSSWTVPTGPVDEDSTAARWVREVVAPSSWW